MSDRPVVVVFGARNVGRAVVTDRVGAGWAAVAVARGDATLERLTAEHPGVRTLRGDAAEAAVVEEALALAERELGRIDLIVNAITAPPRDQSFGGGPVIAAPADRLERWMEGFVPMAWQILRLGGSALARRGSGTLVQVAGGSARRAMPARGPWGAAQAAVRALTQALAQELRAEGVHVALLVADGMIETDRRALGDADPAGVLRPADVAAGVAYLAGQSPRGWTHELVITPPLDTWTP